MNKKLPEINPNQFIVIDLETCDPELRYTAPGYVSKVGFVAGIAIRAKEGSWYIPIHHYTGDEKLDKEINYDEKKVIDWLNYTLSGDSIKGMHNVSYDLGWLWYKGVRVRGKLYDTALGAPLLDENRFSYTLDSLGKTYCGEGKFEEALVTAVQNRFREVRTEKKIIRLKEQIPKSLSTYKPFIQAKERVSQFYDLWPKEVQDRYEVLGIESSAKGQTKFLVPCKREKDIKALLWATDPREMGTYPIQDVDLTYTLALKQMPLLKSENLIRVLDLENELTLPLLEMRIHGVRIDMERAKELDIKYTEKLSSLFSRLETLCGFPVDVNIDADLIKICEKFNLKYAKTAKGNPCFSSEEVPKDSFGIFDTILEIRNYLKARDTYIRGYIFGKTLDGWLHGQYNQLKSDEGGTVTGRLSSSDPNMQNLPNPKSSQIGVDIRGLFLPDNDNEEWLSLDYSGQEPKMLVHTVLKLNEKTKAISRNQDKDEYIAGAKLAATEDFRGRSADFHTAVAKICVEQEYKILGKDLSSPDFMKDVKAFRPKAKSIGLGVMYGSGNKKVASEMTKKGFPMTEQEAADIRSNIYKGVPFLQYISKRFTTMALEKGYIRTILGRKGRFDVWECPVFNEEDKRKVGVTNFGFKSRQEAFLWYNENKDKYNCGRPQRAMAYKALNKYIQGSSADQTKTAMLHLYKRNNLELNALDIFYRDIPGFEPPKFKTQVHDEINVSITKDEDPKWYQDVMEHCLPLLVEVVADPVICKRWSEAK